MYASGGNQLVSGSKVFTNPIGVPLFGGTGETVARLYVDNAISSLSGTITGQAASLTATQSFVGQNTFALPLNVPNPVSTGNAVNFNYLSGVSGVLQAYINNVVPSVPNVVTTTGDETIGGSKTFTGSPLIPVPTVLNAAVDLGTLLNASGVLSIGGGGGAPNSVTTTGVYTLSGSYTFTGSPLVVSPTLPSGATNIIYVSGVSGSLSARDLSISGALQAAINATSGSTINNNYSFTGITGNFVNMSFYYNASTLATGLNNVEAFVGRTFFFTGYAIGSITSGTQGIFSGSLYQRTPTNTKTNFINFSMNSGLFFTSSGGFNQQVTGLNRVGLDIFQIGTGLTGLSIGIFGVGY